jgi:hypothetical protein
MSDHDFDRILDEAIRLTGVERYRYLCTEHPDPATREQYRGYVAIVAAQGGHPPIPVSYGDPAPPTARRCCGGNA